MPGNAMVCPKGEVIVFRSSSLLIVQQIGHPVFIRLVGDDGNMVGALRRYNISG